MAPPHTYVMNLDGSGQQEIEGADGQHPIMSHDGKVFYSNYSIYVMEPNSKRGIALTTGSDYDCVLSPDGSKIAFQTQRTPNHGVQIMNVDGSGERSLSNEYTWMWGPCFSPDSQRIAYAATRNGVVSIFACRLDGSDEVRITPPLYRAMFPAWGSQRYPRP